MRTHVHTNVPSFISSHTIEIKTTKKTQHLNQETPATVVKNTQQQSAGVDGALSNCLGGRERERRRGGHNPLTEWAE